MGEKPFARDLDRGDQHFIQLFDGPDSLADAVAAFVQQGLLNDETALLAPTPEHWLAIEQRLRAADVDVDRALAGGQLIVRDAARTLRLFERRGRLDPHLFDASIGAQVRELVARGNRVRIFGEIVDLLAVQGNYAGAQLLENLWGELHARMPFTLFCGYSSENFGDPLTSGSLRSICRSHSHVRSNPNDLLGSFLLRTHIEA
jgi:MEDS: MEthanogen/methylotroph, DcmR Sensory domain